MDYAKYRNQLDYPSRPKRPHLPDEASPDQIRQYACEIENYQDRVLVWEKKINSYCVESMRLHDLFRRDAIEDVGATGHPMADLLFNKAWDFGHSDGYESVMYYMKELSELIS